jgi:hypothetical protein
MTLQFFDRGDESLWFVNSDSHVITDRSRVWNQNNTSAESVTGHQLLQTTFRNSFSVPLNQTKHESSYASRDIGFRFERCALDQGMRQCTRFVWLASNADENLIFIQQALLTFGEPQNIGHRSPVFHQTVNQLCVGDALIGRFDLKWSEKASFQRKDW